MTANTKTQPGEFDAFEKAHPGELIFTLLERDPCAPGAIAHWCDARRKLAMAIEDDEERTEELRQITAAEQVGMDMIERQAGQETEAPPSAADAITEAKVELTGTQQLQGKLRAELSEADYHATRAVDVALKLHLSEDLDNETMTKLSSTRADIHELALSQSPHRQAIMSEGQG